ncbi:MAG TPA: hypothetical protein VFE27_08585, partial [Acidobacteriaceae bacterium]|nr:hypothetical protein [Acidobacteriaceae bacterium]
CPKAYTLVLTPESRPKNLRSQKVRRYGDAGALPRGRGQLKLVGDVVLARKAGLVLNGAASQVRQELAEARHSHAKKPYLAGIGAHDQYRAAVQHDSAGMLLPDVGQRGLLRGV